MDRESITATQTLTTPAGLIQISVTGEEQVPIIHVAEGRAVDLGTNFDLLNQMYE